MFEIQPIVPRIRFPEYTGNWEINSLGDYLYLSNEHNDGTYNQNDVLAAALGTELQRKTIFFGLKATEESVKNYKIVKPGDIIYTKSPIKGFPNGIIRASKGQHGIVPTLYCVYHCKDGVNASIIQAYFEDKNRLEEYLKPLVNVGARNNVNITDIGFLCGKICIPENYEEQQKIVSFLSSVDEIIAASEQEVANLETQKKAVMKKIFLQEVRFKTEDGTDFPKWEEDSLINLCNYVDYRGKTPEKVENGVFLVTAKNIRMGYIDYDASHEYIPKESYEEVMHRGKPLIGDVLFTTEAPCGMVAQVDREDIALAQRVIKYQVKDINHLDNTYLKYALMSDIFQTKLDQKATGGTVKGIKGSVLHEMTIFYPPAIKEQHLIADFLSDFDEAIAAAKKELELWKELKKGLLQQMFV